MTTARLAALPIDHLLAEMAVLPLASEAALRLCITELDPFLEGDTTELWREAERRVLGCFPGFSVDEAVAVRDYFWFREPDAQKTPLHDYLPWLARQFLEKRGLIAVPFLSKERGNMNGQTDLNSKAAQARSAWRWLSFALPPDLLLASLDENDQCAQDIDLLSPSLDRHLRDKGYAEIHLHIGAAMEFPLLWAGAMRKLIEPDLKENAFASPGADFCEGKRLAPWLLRAAIVRYVLASFLSQCEAFTGFADYLTTSVHPRVLDGLGLVTLSSLLLSLAELTAGTIDDSGLKFAHLQQVYRLLLGPGFIATPFPKALEQIAEIDPISVFLPGAANPEMRFVAMGLNYLKTKPDDRTFAVLFWQAIRVRALFYRHVVQRPMTPGLQWFVRFFDRMGPAKRRIIGTQLNVESATMIDGLGRGLRSLEFRTAPNANRSEFLTFIKEIDFAYESISVERQVCDPCRPRRLNCSPCSTPIELGLVLHFAKSRGESCLKYGKPGANWRASHADPTCYDDKKHCQNPTGYRYANFYTQKRNEAQALAWILWHFPCSLGLIRGIDVCTDELGVPTWVVAPLFRYLREISNGVSEHLSQRCGVPVPPLRLTAHTGEDFIHLMTGLRNVDEAMCRFDLREGDRIGHGVALGVDPDDWSRRAGRIPMLREERLFDLAWEWNWYASESMDPPPGRAPMLEREIARLSQELFGKPVSPYQISLFVEYLYNEDWLKFLGFPNAHPSEFRQDDEYLLWLVIRYLTNATVFIRGRETEWVDPISEGKVLEVLQSGLRKKLGQKGIAVEVNPSSNLLIGDMSDLGKHPLWRLHLPPRAKLDVPPVSICIGSDDPLTFATNLRQEYQFVHDALVSAGCSEAEASEWLDQVRETGLDYRFTLDSDKKPTFTLPEDPFHPQRQRLLNPVLNFARAPVKLPP